MSVADDRIAVHGAEKRSIRRLITQLFEKPRASNFSWSLETALGRYSIIALKLSSGYKPGSSTKEALATVGALDRTSSRVTTRRRFHPSSQIEINQFPDAAHSPVAI